MPDAPFDLREFNRLPRPDIAAAIAEGTPQSLGRVFPYLFKPNRCAAWADDAVAFPLKDRNLRWLFRLPTAPAWKGLFLVAVGTDGSLSLWQYRLLDAAYPEQGGGLFQRRLSPHPGGPAGNPSLLRLGASGDANDRSRGFFFLERVLCAFDREGGVRMRLLAPGGEHCIAMDLGAPGGEGPVLFSHQLRPVAETCLHGIRQVGGWADGEAFYWDTNAADGCGQLFSGSRFARNPYALDGHRPGLLVRAAATDGQWVAAGGDDERIWIGRHEDRELGRSPSDCLLRGYVRSLAMVPRQPGGRPLILAGCDDHFLHVLDTNHVCLQKADLGGIPEAVLPLQSAPDGAWHDLAVLVRDRGMICLRLLSDRLRDPAEPHPACQDRADRQAFLDRLQGQAQARPGLLRAWLRSPERGEQLLGLGLLLHRPDGAWGGLDIRKDLPLAALRHETIDFAAHTIKRLLETLALDRPDGDSRALGLYLDLIEHFVDGPYRTRLAVRRLGGWLLTLQERFPDRKDLHRRVDALMSALPDAKRLLRKHAKRLCEHLAEGRPDAAEQALGALVALEERLRFKRLFNEIILAPVSTSGRVDAVAILKHGNGLGLQVFGRRGESCLGSFRNRFETEQIRPIETARRWPAFADPGASDIRALVPLDPDLLLAVCEDRICVVRCPCERPDDAPVPWHRLDSAQTPGSELYCAAARRDADGYLVALGADWLPHTPGPVALWELDADGRPSARTHLPTPDWGRRPRINALAWDSQGRLWAATGGPGYLLYWDKAGDGRWRLHELVAVGSPQYALTVVAEVRAASPASASAGAAPGPIERILSGGEDGVLRALTPRGSLEWARILPGAILGIGTRQADAIAGTFAPISVITERDTIALYDFQGSLLGMLQLPGEHLTALASATVAPVGVQHHLLGTLRGEVRLLEEVPAELSKDPLAFIALQGTDRDHLCDRPAPDPLARAADARRWEDIRATARGELERLEANAGLCRRWIGADNAIAEPLRAAWAARRLLLRHGDYDSAVGLLERVVERTDAHARELRAHVFGALGECLPGLPERLEDRFVALCSGTLDGALASLLTRTPAQPCRPPLWARVLEVARDKVRKGYPFVSSAVLQRVQGLPQECVRDGWLALLLAETATARGTLHPGFVQGMIGIVLRQIGYGENGILEPFAHPAEPGVGLVAALGSDAKAQGALLDLLGQFSGALLRDTDHLAWRALAAALRADPETLYERLRTALHKAKQTLGDAPDLDVVRRHLALFPRGAPEELAHWRADALTELRRTTDDLRRRLHRVHILAMPVDESLVELDELKRRIAETPAPSPLVVHVHAAWQRRWQAEVQREHDRLARLQDLECNWPELPQAVQQVFRVMHEAGFRNGRFYRIHYLPGCGEPGYEDCTGLVELRSFTKAPRQDAEARKRHPLTGALAARIGAYRRPDKPAPDTLVCKRRPADRPGLADEGLRYWQEFWDEKAPSPVFEIPVLRREENEYRAVGLFAFDLPADPSQILAFAHTDAAEYSTPLIRDALRPALGKVLDTIREEEEEIADRVTQRFEQLDTEMLRLKGADAMQRALLRAAMEVAEAEDGLLVVKSAVGGLLSALGATPQSQRLFEGVRLSTEDRLIPVVNALVNGKRLSIPSFETYPDAERIRAQLAERFASAGKAGRSREWLERFGSALVLPVKIEEETSEEETLCAISLRHSRPYAFYAHHLKAVSTLLLRYRWYFKVRQLYDERTHWTRAFAHEVRSDLVLVKQPLQLMRERPERSGRLLDAADRQLRKLYDLSQNVLDHGRSSVRPAANADFDDPGAILGEIVRLYGATADSLKPVFRIAPGDLGAPPWRAHLRGDRTAFERVLRNLMDNAVKYGRTDIRIDATLAHGQWQLRISNPGEMTEEEDKLKFTPFVKPAQPRFDGSHVGLAASLGLVRAVGGTLALENRASGAEAARVEAILLWPVAQAASHPD